MDFYPKNGSFAKATALDMNSFSSHIAYNKDFNNQLKADFTYRGAYSNEGANSGWVLKRGIKPL
jgi:hypothetical protein